MRIMICLKNTVVGILQLIMSISKRLTFCKAKLNYLKCKFTLVVHFLLLDKDSPLLGM